VVVDKNTAYSPRNIQPTVPYGGGSVIVWGCICHDCKLYLVTIQGNLTGDQYIRDVVVIAAAIPDAMLLPTDECFAKEVPKPVCDGLTCPKYDLWDSNLGAWRLLQGTSSHLSLTVEAQ
jgi:hypothetical protein